MGFVTTVALVTDAVESFLAYVCAKTG